MTGRVGFLEEARLTGVLRGEQVSCTSAPVEMLICCGRVRGPLPAAGY